MKAGAYRLIPKKDGRMRKILVTTRHYRAAARRLLPALQELQEAVCDHRVVHGFWWGRSPVTNALRHVGFAYSVCFDLQDFFPSVTRGKFLAVQGNKPGVWVNLCFVDSDGDTTSLDSGIAAQGLPTSPMIANIAAAPMDQLLIERNSGMWSTPGMPMT